MDCSIVDDGMIYLSICSSRDAKATLKKSLFPVQRVAEIMASRTAAKSSFFPFFVGGKKIVKKKIGKKIVVNEKKRSQLALIDSPGRWTGNNIFSKGGLKPKKTQIFMF